MINNTDRYYPNNDYLKEYKDKNIGIQAFGARLYADQTLYEYLIEFLLIFISKKSQSEDDMMKFHNSNESNFDYYTELKIGLKRFIFFENSKLETKYDIDKELYKRLKKELEKKIEKEDEDDFFQDENIAGIFQEFFYGFAAILKNRSWYAQSLLPLCPEIIFPESIAGKSQRKIIKINDTNLTLSEIEKYFKLNEHDFLARGGEVYYLHILLGLKNNDDLKRKLEYLLKEMISNKKISKLARVIQSISDEMIELKKEDAWHKKSMKFIPYDYEKRGEESCKEIINLLSNGIDNFKKIELFAVGMMLQISRMIQERSIMNDSKKAFWIVSLCDDDIVKKFSIESYNEFESQIDRKLREYLDFSKEINFDKGGNATKLKDGGKHSINLVRKLGKQIGLIVPPKGKNMRFTFSEEILKFLVLAIVKPREKMEFNTFLDKLYEKFGIVISPEHIGIVYKGIADKVEMQGYFEKNKLALQNLLKNIGFLRNLSDATSIVENPYDSIIKEGDCK